MVSVRHDQPLNYDGSVNLALWTDRLLQERPTLNRALLLDVCEQSWLAEQQTPARNNIWPTDHSSFRTGLAMADILVDLGLDEESLVAAIIYRAVREDKLKLAWVRERYGDTVAQLIDGVLRMAIISRLNTRQETVLNQGQNQLEQVRNMLASLIDDVRVALIKIAERACALRAMHHRSPEKRRLLAQEVFSIYAPLAHRLGVGQLKWELEDLSFSYIDPEAYRKIASLLDEKRILREKYIEKIISSLQDTFADHGIAAEVYGRAKHIYSIWKRCNRRIWLSRKSMTCMLCAFWCRMRVIVTGYWVRYMDFGSIFPMSWMTTSTGQRRMAIVRCTLLCWARKTRLWKCRFDPGLCMMMRNSASVLTGVTSPAGTGKILLPCTKKRSTAAPGAGTTGGDGGRSGSRYVFAG